jgi:hypothetical protein
MVDFADILEAQREANSTSEGVLVGQTDLQNIMQSLTSVAQQQLNTMKDVFGSIKTSLSTQILPDQESDDEQNTLLQSIGDKLGDLSTNLKDSIAGVFKRSKSSEEEEDKQTKSLFKRIGKGLSGIGTKLGGLVDQGKQAASRVASGLGSIIKGTLLGASLFALAKLLQSETFATLLRDLLTSILPSINKFLAELKDFVTDPNLIPNLKKAFKQVTAVLREFVEDVRDVLDFFGILERSKEEQIARDIEEDFKENEQNLRNRDLLEEIAQKRANIAELEQKITAGDRVPQGQLESEKVKLTRLENQLAKLNADDPASLGEQIDKEVNQELEKQELDKIKKQESIAKLQEIEKRGNPVARQLELEKLQRQLQEAEDQKKLLLNMNKNPESLVNQLALEIAGTMSGATNVVATDNSTLTNTVNNSKSSTIMPTTIADNNPSIMTNRME